MSDDVVRSCRSTDTGGRAAVSAGSELGADVAMNVLRAGGTAVDAAIAGSAAQCVVEMPWCGIGGDAFVIVRSPDGTVTGLNGSGAAPASVCDAVAGMSKVPRFGAASVAVPAIVDVWTELHDRFGTVALADLLEPAKKLAGDGFCVDDRLAAALARVPSIEGGDQLAALVGRSPIGAGARFVQRDLAETLGAVAADGRDGFYSGVIAKRIADHVADRGGALGLEDLAAHSSAWTPTLSVPYRDVVVHSNGLVSSGALLLVGLSVLERIWPDGPPTDDVETTDVLVRLKRLLFATVAPQLGDPKFGDVPDVLDDAIVEQLAAKLIDGTPLTPGVTAPAGSDTTSLAVAAPDGSTVSFIHSLFNEFGSRELVPDTGIVLNDRLANLVVVDTERATSLPNALVPGKRPLHTLHGYLVEWRDGRVVAGATPGGRGQVQTNLQVLVQLIDRRHALQASVTAPRWVHGMPRSSADDESLYIEPGLAPLRDDLARRGHVVEVVDAESSDRFGNCTAVLQHGGVVHAAADHRRGGTALTC